MEENDHNEDDELVNGDVSKDLSTDENIVDPIEDRRTLAERNERLQDQLQVIQHLTNLSRMSCFLYYSYSFYCISMKRIEFVIKMQLFSNNFRLEHERFVD